MRQGDSSHHADQFTVNVGEPVLEDLRRRLARTRWIDGAPSKGWDRGLDLNYMRSLVDYWQSEFDWRAQEAAINQFDHFRTDLGGQKIHFIHQRGRGPSPLPIVLTHGFPDSFLRFVKIIPMLTDPARHGGDAEDAFDVVVPSIPGYGFSDSGTTLFQVGDLWHELMTRVLGYDQYAAHGGDWGSTITELLARDHGDAVVGIHLTDIPFFHAFRPPKDPSAKEKKYLESIAKFGENHGAYAMIQSAQPQALSLGLNDSPAGLAAWIVEKFQRWSDCDGDVERCFTKDELLANVTLYWVTETIDTSFAPYFDIAHAGAGTWIKQGIKQWRGSSDVPAAFAMFPRDLSSPPREWAERFFDVERWTEMPHGGHFAALEEPQLLVEDVRQFFRPLRRHGALHSDREVSVPGRVVH